MENIVFAANGLVGQAVVRELVAQNKDYIGTCFSRSSGGYQPLDITSFANTEDFLSRMRPRFVYLCANMPGGVNRCEREKEESQLFHVQAVQNICAVISRIGAKLIYISSDYVFSDRDRAYSESDEVSPLNVYGELKVAAEQVIQSSLNEYIIARTTNVFGWDPQTKTPNYFMSTYLKLSQGEQVEAPSCMFGNPTYVDDLARALVGLAESKNNGLFHVVGPQNMSRYEWVNLICKKLSLDESLNRELETISNVPKRPLRAELSTEKLASTLDWSPLSVEEALDLIAKKIGKRNS